jgi:formate hydrogenlyase subunit 6/NADH:ubiquinone oxidoreductase subunit I
MGKDYELAVYSKDDFVWDKTELLVPAAPDQKAPATAR